MISYQKKENFTIKIDTLIIMSSVMLKCQQPTDQVAPAGVIKNTGLRNFTNTLEGSRNAEQIPKQNTPQKLCTELAAEFHFAGFSKDVFRCRPPTNFWGYMAGIFAPPKQENCAEYGKSVHDQFSKMQSRQDVPFSCRAGSVGGCVYREFGYFIRLLMRLMLSDTFAQFDHSVQG